MTWIVWGPAGCGKTRNRDAIVKHFGASGFVDDWSPGKGMDFCSGVMPFTVYFWTSDRAPCGGHIPPGVKVVAFAHLPESCRVPAFPADWAIEKALKECEDPSVESIFPFSQVVTVDQFKNPECEVFGRKLILAHARLIEQTQPAPVDRKLLVAREAFARATTKVPNAPALYREGAKDDHPLMPMVLEAITLWESGYAA